jgi:phosphatidate phosphatase APP1
VLDHKALATAALLQDENTQPVVPGMAAFYGCLREVKPEHPVFALVSGTPAQYEPRVRGFLEKNGFGPFGLYLRDLGPNALSGYKQPVIRKLLQSIPQPVVLVGDSSESDPEVYREIAGEFPGRVRAIYIRDAGRAGDAARFKDMVLFKEPGAAAKDAVARGLASKACVDKAFGEKK